MTRWLPTLEQIGWALTGATGVLFAQARWIEVVMMSTTALGVLALAELRRRDREGVAR